jgi:hypothetical protein
MFHHTPLLAAALVLSTATAQHVTYAEGPPGGRLEVWTFAEADPAGTATRVIAGLELVTLEITNRTAQAAWRSDRSRLVVRDGVRFVELPGNGRLYRFRENGGQRWGFLWIRADGSPEILLATAGIGGTADPFGDRIGVAPDGRHALVPDAAGSSLWIVRLDGTTFPSTGTAWRRIFTSDTLEPFSPTPGANVAFWVTEDERLWRVDYADGAAPVDLTPPSSGGDLRMKDEVALAGDGRSVVFLYGPNHLFRLYRAGETGAATALPPPAADYEEPGYLPEFVGGPRMLLNDDGSRLLYVEGRMGDELFVLDIAGATPTLQVTSDVHFQPYISTVILPVAFGAAFLVGIGDPARLDLYAAATEGQSVANVTRTGGNTTAPYQQGLLDFAGASRTADGSALLVDAATAGGAFRALVRYGAAGLELVAHAPAATDLATGFGTPGYRVRSPLGDVLLDASGSPRLAVPAGVSLSLAVAAPGGVFSVFHASAGSLRAAVLDAGGALVTLGLDPALRELAVTATGAVVYDGHDLRFANGLGVVTVRAGHPGFRRVLSGHATGQ